MSLGCHFDCHVSSVGRSVGVYWCLETRIVIRVFLLLKASLPRELWLRWRLRTGRVSDVRTLIWRVVMRGVRSRYLRELSGLLLLCREDLMVLGGIDRVRVRRSHVRGQDTGDTIRRVFLWSLRLLLRLHVGVIEAM
jgi:hypothetical protein